MMILIEIIKAFTCKSLDNYTSNINSPFEWRENLCATNGNILVIVPKVLIKDFDKLGSFVVDNAPDIDKVTKVAFRQTEKIAIDWDDLMALLKNVKWKTTNTEKHTITDDCPTCGQGEIDIEVDRLIKKKVDWSPFKLDGFGINGKHLLMITKLFKYYPDNWKYFVSHDGVKSKNCTHTFRFNNNNGIKILVMGIRL